MFACTINYFGTGIAQVFTYFRNLYPIKDIANSPVWGMDKQFKNANLPKEYLEFLYQLRNLNINDSILTLPFYFPAYSVIKDENSNNIYAGASPIKIFSGISNYSGFYSISNSSLRNDFYIAVINNDLNKYYTFR